MIKYHCILHNQVIKTPIREFEYRRLLFCGTLTINGKMKVRINFSMN